MVDSRIPIPELEEVASPPQRDLEYFNLEISEEPLGRGGQTVVYGAHVPDARIPERVAVRQLGDREFDNSIDREEFRTFFEQAETWESLSRREQTEPRWNDSEHIVGVVDIGTNLPWVALEYMDGGSLATRIGEPTGLPMKQAVWIGERLCRGLELAHNSGVAHLDLKPANILFRQTDGDNWDVPKISDWGLARNLLDETSASMEVLSTRYAAPEQYAREEFGRPGTATDIYQLGAVMYALLTGEPPYTGTERSVMFDIVSDELPPPPSARRRAISQELDAVVQTALEPRKSDRYGSIETFKRGLQAIRLDKQVPQLVTERIKPTGTDPVTQWSTFGFGSARRGAPDNQSGPNRSVSTRWKFSTDGSVVSSPAVVNGTVYVGSKDNSLYAVNADTGEKQWQFDTSWYVTSSPAVVNGTVYVGSCDESLYAVDTGTGEKQWQFDTSSHVESSPAVVDGTIYVGSYDKSLYAVDAATGEQQWQFDTSEKVKSSPTVVDGTVYVGSDDGRLYAVDATTGRKQWQFETTRKPWQSDFSEGEVYSSPAVVEDTVYVGSHDSLCAVDAATGEQQWMFGTYGPVRSSPAVVDGTVYVGCNDYSLYAVDTATGEQQWQFDAPWYVRSSPAVVDGTVYVGSGIVDDEDDGLYAVDTATGHLEWQFNTFGNVYSSPAVVDDTVYVGSSDGYLYALGGNSHRR
jgi:outer membrane protein assembly factor BamB